MGARRPATRLVTHSALDARPPRSRKHRDFNRGAYGARERPAKPRSTRDQGRQPYALARASKGGSAGDTQFHSTSRRPASRLTSWQSTIRAVLWSSKRMPAGLMIAFAARFFGISVSQTYD